MKVLMIGDIVGRPGRRAVLELLPKLMRVHRADLIVANGENAAGGNGITREIADELLSCGIDILTMGNHVWDKKDVLEFIDLEPKILRPANYPPGTPGRGFTVIKTPNGCSVGVINLSGRVFLSNLDCPFRAVDLILEEIKKVTPVIIVDFHAEATSEKVAFGWYLAGKVSAVCGTHTHVQTADARVLPRGTAYISDVGMTGPRDSVLGVKKEAVITKFLTQMPVRFEVATGVAQMNAVLIEINQDNGRAVSIERIQEEYHNS